MFWLALMSPFVMVVIVFIGLGSWACLNSFISVSPPPNPILSSSNIKLSLWWLLPSLNDFFFLILYCLLRVIELFSSWNPPPFLLFTEELKGVTLETPEGEAAEIGSLSFVILEQAPIVLKLIINYNEL